MSFHAISCSLSGKVYLEFVEHKLAWLSLWKTNRIIRFAPLANIANIEIGFDGVGEIQQRAELGGRDILVAAQIARGHPG